jgi:hypothetical protein
MPIECVMSSISGDPIDAKPTIMLTTKITEQKKLQENILEVQTMWEPTSPKGEKNIKVNSRKNGLVHLGYNITYSIILFLLFLLTI